jgi:hypothetical protein
LQDILPARHQTQGRKRDERFIREGRNIKSGKPA